MNQNQEAPIINQTQFSGEEPLLTKPIKEESDPLKEKTPSFLQTKIGKIALIGGGIFVIILFLIIFFVMNKKDAPPIVIEDAVVQESTKELSPLQEKVNLLQEQLEEADPTKQALSFPPVDLDLAITEK